MNTKGIDFPLIGMVDGQYVRFDMAVTPLGSQDDILRRVAADLPINIKNAFVLPGGKMAHIQTRAGVIACWTKLSSVRVDTVYTLTPDGMRYPVFKPAPAPQTAEHDAVYVFNPEVIGMRMFFVSLFKLADESYHWSTSYMICKADKRKEIFRPPFPNIFGDARMCMGDNYQHRSPCLADAFSHSLAHLDASRWNSDAMEGLTLEHMKALFSFDKDGVQQPPPKGYKWFDCPACHAVNNLNYGELPIQ